MVIEHWLLCFIIILTSSIYNLLLLSHRCIVKDTKGIII